jgi:ParB family chromosome partitioning protein
VLPWVLAQAPDTLRQLFTFLVATTVTGVYATEPAQQRTDRLAQALGLNMAKWWEATGPSYFQHVSKARAIEVISEATGVPASGAVQALKKDAAVAHAAQAVAGTGWLPTVLRVRPPADASDADVASEPDEGPPFDVGDEDCDADTAGIATTPQALPSHAESPTCR